MRRAAKSGRREGGRAPARPPRRRSKIFLRAALFTRLSSLNIRRENEENMNNFAVRVSNTSESKRVCLATEKFK